MSRLTIPVDTSGLTNGAHLLAVRVTDATGTGEAHVAIEAQNPLVAVDIVKTAGTDPVRLKYRAGNTGKYIDITLDAKLKGHVRVNGEWQA